MDISEYLGNKDIKFESTLTALKTDEKLKNFYYDSNLAITKEKIKNSVSEDVLIIQTVNSIYIKYRREKDSRKIRRLI